MSNRLNSFAQKITYPDMYIEKRGSKNIKLGIILLSSAINK